MRFQVSVYRQGTLKLFCILRCLLKLSTLIANNLLFSVFNDCCLNLAGSTEIFPFQLPLIFLLPYMKICAAF